MATQPQDKPNKNRRPTPKSAQRGPTEVTTASAWRKQTTEGTPLVVPSGNTCLVRPSSGLEMFVRNGSIPNSLMPIIQDAINKGKPPSTKDLDMQANPDLLESVLELTDTACVFMVMEPVVKPVPHDDNGEVIPFSQREKGDFLYVDEILFEDKMFIFNWAVGGTADLEKFRQELGASLELVPGSEDLGG
jgi:hypothetical protein